MSTVKMPDAYWDLWFIKPRPQQWRCSYGLKTDENGQIYEDVAIVQITDQGIKRDHFKVYDLKYNMKAKL